jgi:putative FmdB family regulatory protein
MPLYEYQCTNCGERVEILQRINDPPHGHCPKCGAEMRKLLSAPAIQFKGSGFYKTDYASKSAASSESKSETKTETKSEAKSETKSETKSDSSSTPTSTKSE